uniref:histone deacetylase n=1 Tax=Lactuca sativa TaxID=4236 RepID=A0A9R1VKT4_LACSA|nr:hypothetical protein LSAT_V11C500246320 [Lactuca sativa]
MGFCLHNNAAIAASAAPAAGEKEVLIFDWVLYISLHRHERGRFYPGTCVAHEGKIVILLVCYQVGSMGGEGYCVNATSVQFTVQEIT